MKTAQDWQIRRTVVGRDDGKRRWDAAYQLLLRWTLPMDTDVTPPAAFRPATKEEEDESRTLCTSIEQPPTANPDD